MPVQYLLDTTTEVVTTREPTGRKRKGKVLMRTVETRRVTDNWSLPQRDPNTGTMNPSHDSTVGGDDVIRLTKDGVQLLTMQGIRAIRRTRDRKLLELFQGLTSTRSQFVRVTKGIHQRRTKPHITARLVGVGTFHIWLSAQTTPERSTSGRRRFLWRAIGITAAEGGAMVPSCSVQGVRRRGSISYDVLTADRLARFTPATTDVGPQVTPTFLDELL